MTFIKKTLQTIAILFIGIANAQTPNSSRAPIVQLVKGPTGQLIPPITVTTPQFLSCIVNGITITTSGSFNSYYSAPLVPANTTCTPQAPFVGIGEWTGGNIAAILTYTFSQPITSARISYSAINIDDVATIVTNSISDTFLCNPCGLTITGNNVIQGSFATGTYGDTSLVVASATPFTTITLTDTSGLSGWVIGNPCNFIINPPVLCPSITNCTKVTLDTRYYKATGIPQNTTLSVFTAGSGGGCPQATINGMPCTATNVTIEPITPLPFGCTFNTNGTIRIPAGTLPFYVSNQYNYRFRSIANPNIFSVPYRVDFGIQPRVILSNFNNVFLTIKATNFNGTVNPSGVLTPYANNSKNVLFNSIIYTSTMGFADSAPANQIGNAASNVTVNETTSPLDPFYKINPDGTVGYRLGVGTTTNTVPVGTNQRTLTFQICIAGTTFCANGSMYIDYFYPPLRPVGTSHNLDTLVIAPNPSSDGVFQLSFDQFIKEATLEVHTLTNEKVHSQLMRDTDKDILLLTKLPKGIYVLKVITDDQTVSKKISIE